MTSSPASHRRTISESMFSQGVSPSDSFRTSHWSFLASQGGFSGDFIFAMPDPNVSPSAAHAKECYIDAAASQRERLRWTSASSPSDFVISEDSSDTVEQMRSAGLLRPSVELLACGLCSRWLSQRPPLSTAGMDPPVVAVLSCGHVFHADCLEQSASQSLKQDPPCPQCSPPEKPSKGAAVSCFLKSISHASSSTKNKLSRVGVMTDDGPVAAGKAPQLNRLPSSSGVKSHISSFFSERAKPFSKRTFPFKSRKDSMISDGKFRKPGSPARVSPAKDFLDLDNQNTKNSLRGHQH